MGQTVLRLVRWGRLVLCAVACATASPTHAQPARSRIAGSRVVIVSEADTPLTRFLEAELEGVAAEVRVVHLPGASLEDVDLAEDEAALVVPPGGREVQVWWLRPEPRLVSEVSAPPRGVRGPHLLALRGVEVLNAAVDVAENVRAEERAAPRARVDPSELPASERDDAAGDSPEGVDATAAREAAQGEEGGEASDAEASDVEALPPGTREHTLVAVGAGSVGVFTGVAGSVGVGAGLLTGISGTVHHGAFEFELAGWASASPMRSTFSEGRVRTWLHGGALSLHGLLGRGRVRARLGAGVALVGVVVEGDRVREGRGQRVRAFKAVPFGALGWILAFGRVELLAEVRVGGFAGSVALEVLGQSRARLDDWLVGQLGLRLRLGR